MPLFDKSQPVPGVEADANLVRNNFNALATDQAGSEQPAYAEVGWTWLDTTAENNHILKKYDGTVWREIYHHMESTPIPATVVGASGLLADAQNAGALQGRPVLATAPSAAEVLTWTGAAWAPAAGGGGGGTYEPRFVNFQKTDSVGGSTLDFTIAQEKCRQVIQVNSSIAPVSGPLFGANIYDTLRLYWFPDGVYSILKRKPVFGQLTAPAYYNFSTLIRNFQLYEPVAQGAVEFKVGPGNYFFFGWSMLIAANGDTEAVLVDYMQYTDPSYSTVHLNAATPIQRVGGYTTNDELRMIYNAAQNQVRYDPGDDDTFHFRLQPQLSAPYQLSMPYTGDIQFEYYGA